MKIFSDLLLERFLLHVLQRRAKKYREAYAPIAVLAHDFIGFNVVACGQYERRELDTLEPLLSALANKGIVLDIGANIGNHALHFSKYFKEVHCFEPNRRTFQLLRLNAESHPNIFVNSFGLSSRDGKFNAFVPAANSGGASVERDTGVDGYEVCFELRSYDSLSTPSNPVALVKIDVEGHEAEVLAGMKSMLSRDSPVVLFECNRMSERRVADAALSCLREEGYHNFFSVMPENSIVPDYLPMQFRRAARVCEALVRPSVLTPAIKRVTRFQDRNYSLVFAIKDDALAVEVFSL